MSPLVYLSLKKIKNALKSLLRKPGQLIFIVFICALLGLSIFSSGRSGAASGAGLQNKKLLSGVIFLFFTINAALTAYQGFQKGSTLFKMSDVNILFTSPINSISVLFYGMFQQLVSYVIFNFFLLFQYNWMRASFGIGLLDLVIIIVVFALLLLSSQLLCMIIYIFSAGNPARKKLFKLIFTAIFTALAVYLLISYLKNAGSLLDFAARVSSSAPIYAFPMSGWLTALAYGIVAEKYALASGFFAVWLIFFLLGIWLIKTGRKDYFEDVLVSTELNFSRMEDAKRGKITSGIERNGIRGKLFSVKSGIGRGSGASALYYKHIKENRRKNPFILGLPDIFIAGFAAAFSIIIPKDGAVIAVAAMIFYTQLFYVGVGRLMVELQSHYIYLIPEKPFKKLIWGMMETMGKYPLTALLIAVPVSIILKLSALEAVSLTVAIVCTDILVLSINLISARLFGNILSRGLVILFYFIVAALSLAPGIALGALASKIINISEIAAAFFAVSVWCILISVLYIFLSRNILLGKEYR